MGSGTLDDPLLKLILDRFVRLLSKKDGISADAIERIEELIEQGKLKDHNAILDALALIEEDAE